MIDTNNRITKRDGKTVLIQRDGSNRPRSFRGEVRYQYFNGKKVEVKSFDKRYYEKHGSPNPLLNVDLNKKISDHYNSWHKKQWKKGSKVQLGFAAFKDKFYVEGHKIGG